MIIFLHWLIKDVICPSDKDFGLTGTDSTRDSRDCLH